MPMKIDYAGKLRRLQNRMQTAWDRWQHYEESPHSELRVLASALQTEYEAMEEQEQFLLEMVRSMTPEMAGVGR